VGHDPTSVGSSALKKCKYIFLLTQNKNFQIPEVRFNSNFYTGILYSRIRISKQGTNSIMVNVSQKVQTVEIIPKEINLPLYFI